MFTLRVFSSVVCSDSAEFITATQSMMSVFVHTMRQSAQLGMGSFTEKKIFLLLLFVMTLFYLNCEASLHTTHYTVKYCLVWMHQRQPLRLIEIHW